MSLTYAVLGAGRQGQAAAYDLARFGEAARILLADASAEAANEAAGRLDRLAGRAVAEPVTLDAGDASSVRRLLEPVDGALSALPYALNPAVAAAAVAARCHFADLGGNTDVSRRVLELSEAAREAGVTLVPDCGLAPGLAATLAARAIDLIEEPRSVALRCGGLPARPSGPLGYQVVFSVRGLVNEYLGEAEILRDGQPARIPTLGELETIDFAAPVGRCEAFTTSGGTSTLPRTFRGRVDSLDYKTVRYPGHCAQVRLLRDLGLFSDAPVEVPGGRVAPRDVFERLAERALPSSGPDVVVLRCEGRGRAGGREVRLVMDLVDLADPSTGFSAMQRMTGFPAAMVVALLAQGGARPGACPVESLPHAPLVQGLAARGVRLEESWT